MSPQPNTEPRGGAQPALQTPGRTPENSFRGNGSLSGEAGRSDPCELMTQSGDTAADSFLEVLQRRLIETDAALADSEEQLNASRTNEKLLLQENQELRQILLALETAPVEHGAAARQNDRAHPEGFTYVADFSASSLPAKLPARVRVRDGVLEVSIVTSVHCANVVQLQRVDGDAQPGHLSSFAAGVSSRPGSAGAGAPAHSREEDDPRAGLLPPPVPRGLTLRSVSMPTPQPPLARRSPPTRTSTDAGQVGSAAGSQPLGSFAASLEARMSAFAAAAGRPGSARDEGRASRTGSEDLPEVSVFLQLSWADSEADGRALRLTLETGSAGAMFLEEQVRAWMPWGEGADTGADDQTDADRASLGSDAEWGDKGEGVPACVGRERGCIMSEEHIALLHKALPARLRLCAWTMLYGSKRDGISLRTLYRRAAGRAPTLLVVSDTAGGSFGAFTNEAWKVGPRYRGTGECFVFRLAPEPRIFRWSKLNSFFMLGQPDSIAVGAGGHFALWIDEELHRGTSGDCDTFRSKCLSTAADFEIAYVELWAFV